MEFTFLIEWDLVGFSDSMDFDGDNYSGFT